MSAIAGVLGEALGRERRREGGPAEGDLGDPFVVHRRAGLDRHRCDGVLERVSLSSTDIVYC